MLFLPNTGPRRFIQILFIALLIVGLSLGAVLTLDSVSQAAPPAGRSVIGSDVVFGIAPQNIALSGSQTLTPTGSMYTLAPTDTMTLTLVITDAKPGDLLFFTSTVATNTVFVDTGATAGGSTRTLSTDDVIGFIFSNNKWVEAFFSDNS